MTALQELQREKRELLADMKEAGIKRVSCNNRVDDHTFRCNLRLAELTRAIELAKAGAAWTGNRDPITATRPGK